VDISDLMPNNPPTIEAGEKLKGINFRKHDSSTFDGILSLSIILRERFFEILKFDRALCLRFRYDSTFTLKALTSMGAGNMMRPISDNRARELPDRLFPSWA